MRRKYDLLRVVDLWGWDVKRTEQQNKALHLWFDQLATALNDAGLPIPAVLEKKSVDVEWNDRCVKELLWRPIQVIVTGKESTTKPNASEYTKIYEILNRHMGTIFGVHVPFPSMDRLENKRQGGGNL